MHLIGGEWSKHLKNQFIIFCVESYGDKLCESLPGFRVNNFILDCLRCHAGLIGAERFVYVLSMGQWEYLDTIITRLWTVS